MTRMSRFSLIITFTLTSFSMAYGEEARNRQIEVTSRFSSLPGEDENYYLRTRELVLGSAVLHIADDVVTELSADAPADKCSEKMIAQLHATQSLKRVEASMDYLTFDGVAEEAAENANECVARVERTHRRSNGSTDLGLQTYRHCNELIQHALSLRREAEQDFVDHDEAINQAEAVLDEAIQAVALCRSTAGAAQSSAFGATVSHPNHGSGSTSSR